MSKRLLFISTNKMWSGSEVLWQEAASRFMNSGFQIGAAVYYDHQKITLMKSQLSCFVNLGQRYEILPLFERVVNKIIPLFKKVDRLSELVNTFRPDIVIISQGNDFGSLQIMNFCFERNLRFVTITQLVTELQWLLLNTKSIESAKKLYRASIANYFVSFHNLRLHEFMIGEEMDNCETIWNPAIRNSQITTYPSDHEVFKFGFVGRIECFHKGLDLLLEVVSSAKWKSRPIEFNLYGDGPHVVWIQNMIEKRHLNFITLRGYTNHISEVWRNNHIMILPSRMEGQSLALLEALSCGRTAIVTDVGGAREVIQDNITGFIARAATIYDLDEAMERAWQKRDKWETMGIVAQQSLKRIMPDDAVAYFADRVFTLIKEDNA